MIVNYIKSLEVIAKFSYLVSTTTIFFMGLIINNELIVGVSGIMLLIYLVYRKINQLYMQMYMIKNIPTSFKSMMESHGMDIFEENQEKKKNYDERGYQ